MEQTVIPIHTEEITSPCPWKQQSYYSQGVKLIAISSLISQLIARGH